MVSKTEHCIRGGVAQRDWSTHQLLIHNYAAQLERVHVVSLPRSSSKAITLAAITLAAALTGVPRLPPGFDR